MRQIEGIQILRFIAAMLVVGMHTTETIGLRVGSAGLYHFGLGSSGVDIFFVISGFVLASTAPGALPDASARRAACVEFIKRRLIRIVPLYWFYVALKIGLVVALPALALRTVLEPTHVLASLLFWPTVSPWGLIQPVLPVGWSLQFEMLFYVIFAAAIASGLRRALLCIAVFASIFVAKHFFEVTFLTFFGQTIIFEFILGVLIADIHRRVRHIPAPVALAAVAIGVLLIGGIRWNAATDRFLTWGIASGLLVFGTLYLEPWIARSKATPTLSFFGDASYSIYLSHTFVVPACVAFIASMGIRNYGLIAGLTIALVLLCGSLSYLWLERPMTRYFKNKFSKRTRATP